MILIEIDKEFGTITQKKPIFQLFDPYLTLRWPWISHKQKILYLNVSINISLHMK